ncbi:hypothetical protein BKA64DRAFT_719164 [Cadophora sp. MPI-SDFR-AT-0126]|nr:hypothetical protein BKA64DRAFT_719164 [Leotiomycetes sp. MPI-SDFR-AT-0126]
MQTHPTLSLTLLSLAVLTAALPSPNPHPSNFELTISITNHQQNSLLSSNLGSETYCSPVHYSKTKSKARYPANPILMRTLTDLVYFLQIDVAKIATVVRA